MTLMFEASIIVALLVYSATRIVDCVVGVIESVIYLREYGVKK